MAKKVPLGHIVKEGKNVTVFFTSAQVEEMIEKEYVSAADHTTQIREAVCEKLGIDATVGLGRRKFAINAKTMKELGLTAEEALNILEKYKDE